MEVTAELIAEWKNQHKKVFKVELGGTTYYYTTLKRDVYINLLAEQATNPAFDYELETIKTCVLHPELPDTFKQELNDKSGLGVVLLEQIMLNSGWEQVESEEL